MAGRALRPARLFAFREFHTMTQTNTPSGGGPSGVDLPERPALADGVELIGEMRETGFVDRQWLVRQGDRFIQLTELLYRVAERMDGRRTLEEIADGVTEVTDYLTTADDVRRLVGAKLYPLGLVAVAEGVTVPARRAPSPLAFGMKARVLGPGAIDFVSRVLGVLFAPVVLIPVLVAVTIAHGWLYFVHGVSGSIREVIYAPGLLLVVLALSVLAGVFHEFGHAAALRYGGGRARAMGVGIYLIYPAFYTDTTDSYRLGRWGRVRTDLGGFYFHLIFALGVMAVYLATGAEFLLLFVLMINLDILYQCLPFVRFDGYWALADLTGVPDFFSQMRAFLRSVLPVRRWRGDKLPNLKPWVRAVFALYVVVTVPVLTVLLFFLFTRLPGIAVAAWDSLLVQVRELSFAMEAGDLLGAASSAAQAFILGLQMLGISYLLYALGRRLLGMLARRVPGVTHTAGRGS